MMVFDTQGKQNNLLKAERKESLSREHQPDIDTKTNTDAVTLHCKHRHKHEQAASFTKGWNPLLCEPVNKQTHSLTSLHLIPLRTVHCIDI